LHVALDEPIVRPGSQNIHVLSRKVRCPRLLLKSTPANFQVAMPTGEDKSFKVTCHGGLHLIHFASNLHWQLRSTSENEIVI